MLLRIILSCPASIWKTYWSVGFLIPHSRVIPLTGSTDDLKPKVNPLILPGWYLNTLLDCRKPYLWNPVLYPGRVVSEPNGPDANPN